MVSPIQNSKYHLIFVVYASSFYSIGRAPSTNATLSSGEVQAVFAGNSSYAVVASGPASYELQARSPDQGASGDESVFVGDVGTTHNNPSQFSNLCANIAVTGDNKQTFSYING